MTAVSQVNWFGLIGRQGVVTDNTTGTVIAGTLNSVMFNNSNGVYQLNVNGLPYRLLGSDDVTVQVISAALSSIGFGPPA